VSFSLSPCCPWKKPFMARARECGQKSARLSDTQKSRGYGRSLVAASCGGRLFPHSARGRAMQAGTVTWLGAVVLSAVSPFGPAAAAVDETLEVAEQRAFQAAAERGAASTVRIEVAGETGAAEDRDAGGLSTGLVVGRDGWIVTSSFAVRPGTAGVIVVLPDGSRHAAKVVGGDPSRKVVLLKIEPPRPLVEPEVAAKADMQVGQWTLGLGYGWGGDTPGMAVGVLSAVDRSWGKGVQTDASISPANYGGPLLDIRGRVVGMLAPLAAESAGMVTGSELYDAGIGFAVPLEDIMAALPRMQAGETLAAGILGISYTSRDLMTGAPIIATCHPGSPAAKAGIREGDRILSVDGTAVDRIAAVRHQLAVRYAGDTVRLTLERGEPDQAETLSVEATLVDALPPYRRPMLGILPAPAPEGSPVAVAWVWPEGPAAQAGMVAGDLLESLQSSGDTPRQIQSPDQLRALLASVAVGEDLRLQVRRGDTLVDVPLRTVAASSILPPPDATGGATPSAVRVELLTAPEVANAPVAVIPELEEGVPMGVLIHFGPPQGAVTEADAEPWRAAAGRYGIAVILPGSGESDRWSRDDLPGIARAIESLRSRGTVDPTRIACSGESAGAAFAWLAAETFAGRVHGVALIDGSIPRRSEVPKANPGQPLSVLFGHRAEGWSPEDASRQRQDEKRLDEAAVPHAMLPAPFGPVLPTDDLCRWAGALGVL
jgi:serine protease Do